MGRQIEKAEDIHELELLTHWPPSMEKGWTVVENATCKTCLSNGHQSPALRHPRFDKCIGCERCVMYTESPELFFNFPSEPDRPVFVDYFKVLS